MKHTPDLCCAVGGAFRIIGGLKYYQSRCYLPALRRFISPDTVVPGAGNPQNLNRYSYVNNNPVNYVDPSGHALAITSDADSLDLRSTMRIRSRTAPTAPSPVVQRTPGGAGGGGAGFGGGEFQDPFSYRVAEQYDPMFENAQFYDAAQVDNPLVSANYSLWRASGICEKCHVAVRLGHIPTNSELDAYSIGFRNRYEDLGIALHLLALNAAGTTLRSAVLTEPGRPTASQLNAVEAHLQGFSNPLETPEQMMLDRLRAGHWTPFDQRFFNHEVLEMNLMINGTSYEDAHLAALGMQGIDYGPGYEAYLYHPEVIFDPYVGQWFNETTRALSSFLQIIGK